MQKSLDIRIGLQVEVGLTDFVNGVTEKTMVNCWRKLGLCSGPEESWIQ